MVTIGPTISLLLLLLSLALASASIGVELPNDLSLDEVHSESQSQSYYTITTLRRLAVEFIAQYQNITIHDLAQDLYRDKEIRLPTTEDLRCLADLQTLANAVSARKFWALRMIDSWGTLPSGILYGNLVDLGNFDECLGIDHAETSTHSVQGKYCLSKLQVAPSFSAYLSLKTAVCFPASCSAAHMDTMLRRLLQNLLNIELNPEVPVVNEGTCKTADREPYDALTIFTIVLLSILCALMLLSTVCDYLVCQDEQPLNKWIKAFSARANSRVLFRLVAPRSNPNVIDCIHGIRVLSFIWVVFGHVYLVYVFGPNMNFVKFNTWRKSPYSMLLQHAAYSVDTFFFLSGLLMVVIALRAMERTKGKLNVSLMYLHRYLRLTPVLALAIIAYITILPRMGDGPMYGKVNFDDYSICKDTWYWTLLYVQNYATNQICLGHSWYLAVDMQLYIIAPILLIALYKWKRKAVAGIVVAMLLLAACLFSIMVIEKVSLIASSEDSMKRIYFSTHTRASPYLIGILFGYFLHVNRGKSFKLSPIAVILGWVTSLALLFSCLFAVYGYAADGKTPPIVEEAFYLTFTRIAWPLGLCWVVFACMQGYGGLANSFLSSPLWQPLSKLSYSAYIFHMFMESLNAGITRTNTYFSNYQVMLRFWGDFGFTMLLAYFVYILIEAPFGNLESLLLPIEKPSAPLPAAEQVKEAPVGCTASAPTLENKSPLPA
ncbi:nose resistant to fluoxetine protein 6-like isoform X2 [Drosophila santomea]|uniref:nose resistant to fluoxetine protein 6-like isoform X2 n=1 Tax=Drosophila santomea TaxID=129105 RepID=UPI001953485C|nr:nose resistant to fluoxetine protein 6-like isoform X2 [Drosophila santomea]